MIHFIISLSFFHFSEKSFGFILHTFMGLLFILASCQDALFHTPSHGRIYLKWHIIIGRVALLTGTCIVISFYLLILTDQSPLSRVAQITFMITRAFMMQFFLLFFIKRENHLISACILFYCCALLPAVNRMPQVFGFQGHAWIFFCFLAIGYYRRKMKL